MRTLGFEVSTITINIRSIILSAMLLVLVASCSKSTFIDYDATDDGVLREILLKNPGNADIRITGSKENGCFYFQADDKINLLDFSMATLHQSNKNLAIEWKHEDHVISLRIEKKEDYYALALESDSSAAIDKWGFWLHAAENEYYTGLMERVVDGHQSLSWRKGTETALNLRGEKVTMLTEPTMGLYTPFFLSSSNYGLFIDGTWPGLYDFDSNGSGTIHVEFEGPTLNARLWFGKNPATIVKNHSLFMGPSLLPPEWAFKPIRWRDEHRNLETYYDGTPANSGFNSMVVEDILMMKALEIPVGAYWFDRPWAKGRVGYDDLEWDQERFPNPQDMLDWLIRQGIRPLIWIAPWVAGDMARIAVENNYHIPMTDTLPEEHQRWQYLSGLELVDLTDVQAKEWWKDHLIELLNQGIRGFKMDRAEEMVPYNGNHTYANGKTYREMRNAYPVYYAKAAYEAARDVYGDDFLNFLRAGYTHSSRYATFWGGDIATSHEGLRAAIIASQRAAIIGFPIWGSDIGGYWQGSMTSELTCRWLAFGCFNPLMEFGPTENRGPWNMNYEPSYDTIQIATWRTYAIIHDDISAYTYRMAKKASETGMPIIRPLFLEYPDLPQAWSHWQTFKYGDDLLIHAIWDKDKQSSFVFLPEGSQWIDAWNPEKVFEGGQEVEIKTPVYKIPVFLRKGSSLELTDFQKLYQESLEVARQVPDLEILSKNIE
jgi:alpha-D-xyloside xylohydrolase